MASVSHDSRRGVLLGAVLLVGACGDHAIAPDAALLDDGAPVPGDTVPTLPGPCPEIYSPDILPTFEIEIATKEWKRLHSDQKKRAARELAGKDYQPYHPLLAFRWGGNVATDAAIRLKGHKSWYEPKLQFVISFKENNQEGRFLGLRKIVLDATVRNPSYLRDRLALALMRDMGVPAPCANSARLIVNGEYYGLYTNIEKVDREFLERNFDDPNGNLYKGGEELVTNEDENPDTQRLDDFWSAHDVEGLAQLAEVEEGVLEWAAEGALPDGDGYFVGRDNFYLYDHPTRGFLWLPWDLDKTFDWAPANSDPIRLVALTSSKHPHFKAVLADPMWRRRYLEAIGHAIDAFDPAVQLARFDAWSAQIAAAAAEDPNLGMSVADYQAAVRQLRTFLVERRDFLTRWLTCQRKGDVDDDDSDWCNHCGRDLTCRR